MSLQTVIRVENGVQLTGESSKPSGHVIENPSGTDSTQRNNLQFADAHVSDDSTNSRTVVETLKPVTSATFETETEDGFYFITDEDEQPLTADDIPYDSNTSVGDRLDELLGVKVCSFHKTGTTQSSGNLGLFRDTTVGEVISVTVNSPRLYYAQYFKNEVGDWYCKIRSQSNDSVLASQSADVTAYYIPVSQS